MSGITKQVQRLYRAERAKQWQHATAARLTYGTTMAQAALRSARIRAAFEAREDVRISFPQDEHADLDDLKGDCFDPHVNSHLSAARLAREERAFEARVERDGVVGMVGEYFDGEQWQHADSVWGFVGEEDARESGYMEDVMEETMRQADAVERCEKCGRPAKR